MERDEVRSSLTLYFLLSNNVCLLNWSTHSVELCYFLLFILMILLMHFPLGCIFQNDSSLTPDIQAFLLPANEVMTYHLGWLDNTFLLGLPQSCATVTLQTTLGDMFNRVYTRGTAVSWLLLFLWALYVSLCYKQAHFTEHASHQKGTFAYASCKTHFTQPVLVHHSSIVHFALSKGHAILVSLKMLWKVG